MEKTFVCVKPDGVQRGLIGEVVKRFENRGFILCAAKFMQVTPELASKHYAEHVGKPFYEGLVKYITSGPVFAMVWEGENAVQVCRNMMGKTNPQDSAPGTIRGDYCMVTGLNIIHGSDSPESAAREIGIFFKPEELVDYTKDSNKWLYE